MILKQLRIAIITTVLFAILTGLAYPLAVTGLGQLLFPGNANGSIITENGKAVGSELIGQPFSDPKYFWGRLSATSPFPYNAAASSGSNFGPTNPALFEAVKGRIKQLHDADSTNTLPIPVDLVTASGSGLDPNISVAAAQYQMARVAHVRGLSVEKIQTFVEENTESRQLGFLGEPRVNVLKLNLALDAAQPKSEATKP